MRTVVGIDVRRGFIQRRQAEGVDASRSMMMEVEEQNAQQHQDGAGQGVEEEFDGGVEFARASPDPDQQVHRDEHGFPEHEEEEEIERHKDAEHAGLKKQKPDVVFLDAILDRGPGREDRDPSQKRGEHDQQEGNAINAEHIPRADGRNPVPRPALDELESRLEALRPEHWDQRQRNQEAGDREEVRDPPNGR